jgi:hypothetical protein
MDHLTKRSILEFASKQTINKNVFGKLSIDVLVGKLKYYYTYIEKLIAYSPGVVGFVYVRKTNKNISQIEKNIPPYY